MFEYWPGTNILQPKDYKTNHQWSNAIHVLPVKYRGIILISCVSCIPLSFEINSWRTKWLLTGKALPRALWNMIQSKVKQVSFKKKLASRSFGILVNIVVKFSKIVSNIWVTCWKYAKKNPKIFPIIWLYIWKILYSTLISKMKYKNKYKQQCAMFLRLFIGIPFCTSLYGATFIVF